jgi:HD-like signal output (HDOD) protein
MEYPQNIMNIIEYKMKDLPTLPQVLGGVLDKINNPRSTTKELSDAISFDQRITTQILRLVNSSFYGIRRQITTVSDAIVMLGFQTIRNLVLASSVFNIFKGTYNTPLFNYFNFWRHSIQVAISSQFIGKRKGYILLEELFITGMLHDIGKILIAMFLPKEFNKIANLMQENGKTAIEAEEEILGINHSFIGKWLAERWELPLLLIQGIAYHHYPLDADGDYLLSYILHSADYYVNIAFDNIVETSKKSYLIESVDEWLGWHEEPDKIKEFNDYVTQKYKAIEDLISNMS